MFSDDSRTSTIRALSLSSNVVSEKSLGLPSDSIVMLVNARPLLRLHITMSFELNGNRSTPCVESKARRVILNKL